MTSVVLIAEGDAILRSVLIDMCQELGFQCIAAVDGQDCLNKLSEHLSAINVVLMDLHMPRVSGLDALISIRKSPHLACRSKPVIAITADIKWHDPRAAVEQGFDGVLEKPMKLERLQEVLARFQLNN